MMLRAAETSTLRRYGLNKGVAGINVLVPDATAPPEN
jgi:hypothetical protein